MFALVRPESCKRNLEEIVYARYFTGTRLQPMTQPHPEENNFSEQAAGSDQQRPVEQRQGERRQAGSRREGVRGLWEERRLFDRRKREYSMFGKRFDGSDDEEIDVSKVPEVADELLISPAEIEIFREQEEAEQEEIDNPRRRHDDEPRVSRRGL